MSVRYCSRRTRVLLTSPHIGNRAFLRRNPADTAALFAGMSCNPGERMYLQHYLDGQGWITRKSKGATHAASA
jgi:hypothetical protein